MEEIYRTATNQPAPCGAEVLGTSLYHSEVSLSGLTRSSS